MRIVYQLLVVGLLLGPGNSPPAHAQSPRTYPFCWLESKQKEDTGYGYKLQVTRQGDQQTTLRIYFPWAHAQFNPRYVVRYDAQGRGTWQQGSHPAQQARVVYLGPPSRWRVVVDSTEFVIHTTNRPLQ